MDGGKLPDGRLRVAPFVEHLGDPLEARAPSSCPLIDADGTPLRTIKVGRNRIQSVRYHEQIAVAEVKEFLDEPLDKFDPSNKNYLGRLDQIQAGETALAGVLQMHQSARERGARKGRGWDAVEAELRKGLLDVKLMQLDLLVEAKSWDAAFDFAQQLATTFDRPRRTPRDRRPVVGRLLEKAIKDEAYTRDRFRAVRTPPAPDRGAIPRQQQARRADQRQPPRAGRGACATGRRLVKEKKPAEARDLLKQAEETWPDLPGLRDYRLQVAGAYQVLKVGMRELPALPVAGLGAHRRREAGLRTPLREPRRPDAGRPRLAVLPPGAGPEDRPQRRRRWAGSSTCRATPNGPTASPLTVGDLTFTLKQISEGAAVPSAARRGPTSSPRRRSAGSTRSAPRSSSARGCSTRSRRCRSRSCRGARDSTSPARTSPRSRSAAAPSSSTAGAPSRAPASEFAAFKANPHYGARADRPGRPHIRELRIYAPADPVEGDARRTASTWSSTSAPSRPRRWRATRTIEVKLPDARTPNRRIYFLAINHRKPALANADLRIALARAIHREKLLDDHFRKGLGKKVHRAINGPYPAGSWACSPPLVGQGQRPDPRPVRRGPGQGQARAALSKLGQREVSLTLKYPSGDPVLASAVSDLCRQVNETLQGRQAHARRR